MRTQRITIARRVGPITVEQFHLMTDAQLERIITSIWRPFFPGKDCCTDDYRFYLHDGGYYNFLTGQAEDWRD